MATHDGEVPRIAKLTVVTLDGGASRPRVAFVAGGRDVLEVDAAGALQQVPACGGDIAELTGGAREHRLRQHRVPGPDPAVGGEIAVRDRGADPQPATVVVLDPAGGKPADVDEQVRRGDT